MRLTNANAAITYPKITRVEQTNIFALLLQTKINIFVFCLPRWAWFSILLLVLLLSLQAFYINSLDGYKNVPHYYYYYYWCWHYILLQNVIISRIMRKVSHLTKKLFSLAFDVCVCGDEITKLAHVSKRIWRIQLDSTCTILLYMHARVRRFRASWWFYSQLIQFRANQLQSPISHNKLILRNVLILFHSLSLHHLILIWIPYEANFMHLPCCHFHTISLVAHYIITAEHYCSVWMNSNLLSFFFSLYLYIIPSFYYCYYSLMAFKSTAHAKM